MGIRINKMLGWGVADTASLESYHPERLDYRASTDEFLEWALTEALADRGEKALGKVMDDDELSMTRLMLEITQKMVRDKLNAGSKSGISDEHAVWNSMAIPEYGTAFVASEVGYLSERYRYDNSIDFYEQEARQVLDGREPEIENEFLPLTVNIFPHSRYELNDGRFEENKDRNLRVMFDRVLGKDPATVEGGEKTLAAIRGALNEMASKYGFPDYDSYKAELHPEIPVEVMLALHWTGVMDSPTDIRKNLRPCVYTWWS